MSKEHKREYRIAMDEFESSVLLGALDGLINGMPKSTLRDRMLKIIKQIENEQQRFRNDPINLENQ